MTEKVEQYKPEIATRFNSEGCAFLSVLMEPHEKGGWVRVEDYEALAKAHEEMAEEYDKLFQSYR